MTLEDRARVAARRQTEREYVVEERQHDYARREAAVLADLREFVDLARRHGRRPHTFAEVHTVTEALTAMQEALGHAPNVVRETDTVGEAFALTAAYADGTHYRPGLAVTTEGKPVWYIAQGDAIVRTHHPRRWDPLGYLVQHPEVVEEAAGEILHTEPHA